MLRIVGKRVYSSDKRGYNGSIIVYTNKKSVLDSVGTVDFNTASYKGDEGAVMDFLLEKKLITKKLYNSNNGYYMYKMKTDKKLSIQII